MINIIAWLPARVVLVTLLFFGINEVSAQTRGTKDPPSGRIILIEPKEPKGALKVQQASRLRPVNAAEGMLVRRGYLLTLDPKAKATVICGDGKKRQLAPGPHGCPCTNACTPEVCGIRYDGSTIASTRGPDTEQGTFPIVISPRKTLLRNPRPTIRWAPVAGAKESTTYNVTLYAEGMKPIWTKEGVLETRLSYPDNEAQLTPGRTYKVVVTSDGLSSQQDRSPDLGFTMLTAERARGLANEEIKTRQLGLPETQTRFLISNIFAARELRSEAIEQLEDLNMTMKEPAVSSMLGDLYATIGLNREAEKRYLEAISLTAANDFEGLAGTQQNLARVYENLGIFDKAIVRLAEAKKAYRRLGNRAMVNNLVKDERRLRQPRNLR